MKFGVIVIQFFKTWTGRPARYPMPTLEERVADLERRMSDLEGQFGFLMPLTRQIHLDLIEFKEQTEERFEQARFDLIEFKEETRAWQAKSEAWQAKSEAWQAKTEAWQRKVESQLEALPNAVARTVVELLREER